MTTHTIDLGTIDNTLTVGNDDYVITGGNGNNTLTLGTGTDQLTLGNGNNTLSLGGGTDQITAGSGNNTITTTGAGTDTVTATSGNNTIVLGDGPNVVQAGDGLNIVTVGNGNDSVTLGNGFDQVPTGNGNSTITAGNGVGDKITVGTGGNTIVVGTGSADAIHTGSGNNTFSVSGAAVGADSILGALTSGNGTNNKLILTTPGTIGVLGVSGFQTYQLANGGPNNLTLTNANFSRLPGASITVQGGNGVNTVNASALAVANAVVVNTDPGADVITGGAGNDLVNVSDLAFASVDGGGGTNTLALTSSGLSLDLGTFTNRIKNIEVIDLTGTGKNTLVLNAADVLNLSATSTPINTLKVTGNSSDVVSVLDTGWITGATAGGFTTYTNGTAILQLNTALTATGGIGTPFDKTPPVFVNDNPLTVSIAGTGTITSGTLSVSDPDNTASQLTYTITGGPSHGTALKNAVATTQFTQADVNAGLIAYQENGSTATSDSISLAVTDPAGNSVAGSLSLVISAAGDKTAPVFVNDSPVAVLIGGATTITSGSLSVSDPDNTASQLTYTITGGPSRGTVLKNAVATTQFTQADVNAGLITYQENGSTATSDSVSLAVTDPAGKSVSGSLTLAVTTGLINTLGTGQQLELIYIGYFNRAADGGGLTFWQGQNVQAQARGQSASLALSNIANSFMPQSEAIALYPFMATVNPNLQSAAEQTGISGFIDSIYNNLFGRVPDTTGKAYWVGQLTSGAVQVGNAVLAISNGATGSDATEVQNKLAVALDFTTRTQTAALGATQPLTTSFVTAAHSVLNGVDGTSLNDAATTAGEAATTTYINGSTTGTSAALATGLTTASTNEPVVISVSNAMIDPGTGSHTIQFIGGATADTLVLHSGGTDQIAGFNLAGGDVMDLRALFTEARLNLQDVLPVLGSYLTIADQGADAVLRVVIWIASSRTGYNPNSLAIASRSRS